jgi:hypothetical protein
VGGEWQSHQACALYEESEQQPWHHERAQQAPENNHDLVANDGRLNKPIFTAFYTHL